MKDYKEPNPNLSSLINMYAIAKSLLILAEILPATTDTIWKYHMKEIHSKCSRHCKYKRMIEKGEMDDERL